MKLKSLKLVTILHEGVSKADDKTLVAIERTGDDLVHNIVPIIGNDQMANVA